MTTTSVSMTVVLLSFALVMGAIALFFWIGLWASLQRWWFWKRSVVFGWMSRHDEPKQSYEPPPEDRKIGQYESPLSFDIGDLEDQLQNELQNKSKDDGESDV